MPKRPRSIKTVANREIRVAKKSAAKEAIGVIDHNSDTYILTFGQFSLIDALCVILDQTGPADVTISTWTAAGAHLERASDLIESADIKSLRLVIDRSFESRQSGYCAHMRRLFGQDCIRAIRSHSKFMLIRSKTHDVVVRTSMNLNENPRLENIEISEDLVLADFFQNVTDEIFAEVPDSKNQSVLPELPGVDETHKFKLVRAKPIARRSVNEPRTTHTVR